MLPIDETRKAIAAAAPSGVTANLTGVDAIFQSQGGANGPGVFAETLLGAVGALIILLFVFGTLPAVLMPLVAAVASILTTFLCVYGLTYVTDVSIIVQFLVALVGLGISIDYSLLMIFRFREELAKGQSTDDAIIETMQHAGRSVIVSGTTVAIGLVSMVILPLPFIRSIGIGGMLIPLVSVLASITFTPAVLRILGPKINRVRVMPKRLLDAGRRRVRLLEAVGRDRLAAAARDLPDGHGRRRAAADPCVQDQPGRRRDRGQPAAADAAAGRRRSRLPASRRASSSRSPCSSRARRTRRSSLRSPPR